MKLQWGNIFATDWFLSKTFRFLYINDLQALRAVNTSLKDATDSFVESLPGNFGFTFGPKVFSVIASYLSMDDLSNGLSLVSTGCRFSIQAYSATLPPEVKFLLKTWYEKNRAFLMHSFECNQIQGEEEVVVRRDIMLYHPPLLKLSLGPMSFDKDSLTLKGQPLQEIQVNDVPLNLGRFKAFACDADDAGSVVFYCGGELFVEGAHGHAWSWVSEGHRRLDCSLTTGLFYPRTGTWKSLPPMPEARSGGMAVRIGCKVYVFGGIQHLHYMNPFGIGLFEMSLHPFVLVFDLEEEHWIYNNGIAPFPGPHDECHGAVAWGTGIFVFVRFQVFFLDTTSGLWSEMPNLPMKVGAVHGYRIVTHLISREPTLVVFGKKSWAQLVLKQGHEWEREPDLRGHHALRLVRFHKNKVQIFSGNNWTLMESQDVTAPEFYGGRIAYGFVLPMASCLVEYSQK